MFSPQASCTVSPLLVTVGSAKHFFFFFVLAKPKSIEALNRIVLTLQRLSGVSVTNVSPFLCYDFC